MIVQAIYITKYDPRKARHEFSHKPVNIDGRECFLYDDFANGDSERLTREIRKFSENLSTIKDVRCVSYIYAVKRVESTTLFEFEVDEINDESLNEIRQALDYAESEITLEQLVGCYFSDSSEFDDYTLHSIESYYELVKKFPTIE